MRDHLRTLIRLACARRQPDTYTVQFFFANKRYNRAHSVALLTSHARTQIQIPEFPPKLRRAAGEADEFGTAADGLRINGYCRYCYQNGAFTDPNTNLQGMIDRCVGIMVQKGIMPEAQARALMSATLPKLKRWRGT